MPKNFVSSRVKFSESSAVSHDACSSGRHSLPRDSRPYRLPRNCSSYIPLAWLAVAASNLPPTWVDSPLTNRCVSDNYALSSTCRCIRHRGTLQADRATCNAQCSPVSILPMDDSYSEWTCNRAHLSLYERVPYQSSSGL